MKITIEVTDHSIPVMHQLDAVTKYTVLNTQHNGTIKETNGGGTVTINTAWQTFDIACKKTRSGIYAFTVFKNEL